MEPNKNISLGFTSKLTDRRVFSLTGKDVMKMIDYMVINDTKDFFKEQNTRAMNCIVLDRKEPKILFDFFLYRPFLEELPELGDEYWIDTHQSVASSLIHHIHKFSDNHSFNDIHTADISNVIKVQSVQSAYGMTEGDEGKVHTSLQATAPKFPAENDPTVVYSYTYRKQLVMYFV